MKTSVTNTQGIDWLLSQPPDPLVFYRTLPSDVSYQGDGKNNASSNKDLSLDFLIERENLDQLLALMYLRGGKFEEEQLRKLSLWASKKYSVLLASEKSARARRMKLQLINYAAQDLLAGPNIQNDVSSFSKGRKIADSPPWDWLSQRDGTQFMIVSGENGLHSTCGNKHERYHVGLPSQLDQIDDCSISVGSIFSNGGYILRPSQLTKIDHSMPIVIFLDGPHGRVFVDYCGNICSAADGRIVDRISCNHADKVRAIEGKLYISDWSVFGKMYVYDLSSGTQSQVRLNGIFLMNDICAGESCFYVVCKQQGSIFKFNLDFELLEKRLSFGKQRTELFDPISIRNENGRLQVLSWVTGNLTCIDTF